MSQGIDIVMPWVDGTDLIWLKQKKQFLPASNMDDSVNRYRDWKLLKYWFRGIEVYAPWVRKVHFITWGHIPKWLNTENKKLNIVNHKDYIPQKYLPTFSSHTIELNIHRIKDLSEKFIYFNDDTYLIDYMKANDFFSNEFPKSTVAEVPLRFFKNGIDHIIGNDISIINNNFIKKQVIKKNKKQWFSLKSIKSMFKNIYMLPVSEFSNFSNQHMPNAFLKSTLEDVWNKEYDVLDATCKNKFRSNEDVNQWLFKYWQFATGNFIQTNDKSGRFFIIGKDDDKIIDTIKNKKCKIVCLSDDYADINFETEKNILQKAFQFNLSKPSSFERS